MNDTNFDTALQPLDEVDEGILRELREVLGRLDPCPGDLADEVKFALTVKALQAEVAELTTEAGLVSRARDDVDEATTVTFSTDSLSIMITIAATGTGRARIDGWLTCGSAEVRLEGAEGEPLTTTADSDGRFVLTEVPRGAARLLVHPAEGGRPVITPQFTI